ncbi:MAG: phenylacetate--CoA ligase family protein [Candidatus Altiarchaeales archaeon]|nr:MAG: phenylacetate--CoA ligase family protein [Candidatus Altiarchaeales archaeon]
MYSKIYQWVLFPLYESLIMGRKTLQYLRLLQESQWLSEERIRDLQWRELKRLLKHAYRNVPYYRDIFRSLGVTPDDIRTPEDFREIPIIDKQVIRENYRSLIAENYMGRTLTKSTGGTTGIPLQLEFTRDSYEWRRAVMMRHYGWGGYEEGKKVAYLWSVPVGRYSLFSKLKDDLYHKILRQKYFNVFDLTPENMERYYHRMREFKPEHIVAYALQMYYFARYIDENNLEPFPLKSIILGAEAVTKYQKDFISFVFNCPVFETYGCREFMLIASECEEHRGMHISAENLYVEVVKDGRPAEPGEIGEVVITDLHNYGMPFIRYKNGDLAVLSKEKCPCGRGLPLIERVEGRLLDVIRTPDGKILTGVFFPHLMKEFKEVDRFQVIQESIDSLVVKIIPNPRYPNVPIDLIKKEIKKVIGTKMNLEIQLVDDIPLSPSGKFRVTISKITDGNFTL